MNKHIFLLGILAVIFTTNINAQVSPINVKVQGDGFEQRSFQNGIEIFTNRNYVIENAPVQFSGFQFMASDGKVVNSGNLIPDSDGKVYVIAPIGGLNGWTEVPNSKFNYSDGSKTQVTVYEHEATANIPVEIPTVTLFPGASPLAKTIEIFTVDPATDATLSNLSVDGVDMEFFDDETLSYKYYLPYSYSTVPDVIATKNQSVASQVTTQAISITGSESERTATIEITSQDNNTTLTYNIEFEQLPKLDLFLCIGQSNMSGRAPMDASKGDLIPVENAYLLASTTEMIDAVNPFNLYSNISNGPTIQRVSPTFSFSKKVSSHISNKLGLVVNAKGGSDMTSWDQKTDDLYSNTITRAIEAQKWGTYKAVLWHQGESNASSGEVSAYPNQLTNLVANLREDLNSPNLFFVAGQIGQWKSSNDNFNAMITTIPEFINNSACALSNNLTDRDGSHFDRDSQIILGERYADLVLENVYGILGITDIENKISLDLKTYGKTIEINHLNATYDISIHNIVGQKIYDQKNCKEKTIILKNCKDGIYFVEINYLNKRISKKIYLKH